MKRDFEQIKRHFEIEKSIADKIKASGRLERKAIYKTMYDDLFKKIPDHPRLERQENQHIINMINRDKFALLKGFVNKASVVAEFGPGDCNFAISLSGKVKYVYGIDISSQKKTDLNPENFKLIIYDGYTIDNINESSVDVAFSDQIIEHIHPDDIQIHFEIVKRILKPDGKYIFRTPHRFSGPYDISRYFSNEAEGFHLKEWTYGELIKELEKAGYSSWNAYWYAKKILVKIPLGYFITLEKILSLMPRWIRKILAKFLIPTILLVAIR